MSEVAAFLFAAPFLLAGLALVAWSIGRAFKGSTDDPYQNPDNWGR